MLHCTAIALLLSAVIGPIVLAETQPYCHFNETIMLQREMVKTRQVVKEPTGIWKKLKTAKIYTERYLDIEYYPSWHLVRRCCEGYELSKLKLCEPVCKKGCSEHASCVEPNECRCQQGYIAAISHNSGKHYCEPVCELDCPEQGHCSAPNVCECEQGFHVVAGECVPYCSSGCPHRGVCVRPEVCECSVGYRAESGSCEPACTNGIGCQNGVCRKGFLLQRETGICVANSTHEATAYTVKYEHEESLSTATYDTTIEPTKISEWSAEIDNSGEDTTEEQWHINRRFTEATLEGSTTKCPAGFLYYRGECRTQMFASDDVDCHYSACAEHAHCLENGSCACESGYVLHYNSILLEETTVEYEETTVYADATETMVTTKSTERMSSMEYTETTEHTQTNEYVTTTETWETTHDTASTKHTALEEPVCISLQALDELLGHSTKTAAADRSSSWLLFLCIGLAVICLLVMAILLGWKFVHRHSGSIDIKAKNELCCKYERSCLSESTDVY